MNLKKYLDRLGAFEISGEIPQDKVVCPAVDINNASEDSILFVVRRVSGGYSINPEDINGSCYAVVCDYDYPFYSTVTPCIRIENARRALSLAYAEECGVIPGKLWTVGVTGTNGKTTTATLIYEIMMQCGVKAGFIGTGVIKSGDVEITPHNHSMTTPDPALLYSSIKQMQDDGCQVLVMEVSSHSIALDKICGIEFDVGIFTNLSDEHMDFHPDKEDYYLTKERLLDVSKRCIVNIDDTYGARAYSKFNEKTISVGVLNKGDVFATELTYNGLYSTEYYYRTNKYLFKATVKLPGAFNVYNSMIALCCAIEYGISPCKAKNALATIKGVRGRLETIHHSPTVIVDYAHTPIAFDNVLKTLKSCKKLGQNMIVVFGCGGDRDKSKRPVMGNIVSKYADMLVITEDNSRGEETSNIISDIISGTAPGTNCTIIEDRRLAIWHALSLAKRNDLVLILGKGHEMYKIDRMGYHYFNEAEIVREFFESNEVLQ